MSERDCAVAGHGLAAWTLRVEYETVLSPEPSPPDHEQPSVLTAFYEFVPHSDPLPPGTRDSGQGLIAAGLEPAETAAPVDSAADISLSGVPVVRPPAPDDALSAPVPSRLRRGPLAALTVATCAILAVTGWRFVEFPAACWLAVPRHDQMVNRLAADVVARRIVVAESGGDSTARNARSSATGAGQFLDGTWLDMIRAYRPDLDGRAEAEILDLRYDPDISREMVARFAEENAAMLGRRCLPVTPGTLYLSHFAGGAGAAAVLSAPDTADAAATMAEADSTGRTTREMIVTANPFLADFTIADLKRWADRKMGGSASWRL